MTDTRDGSINLTHGIRRATFLPARAFPYLRRPRGATRWLRASVVLVGSWTTDCAEATVPFEYKIPLDIQARKEIVVPVIIVAGEGRKYKTSCPYYLRLPVSIPVDVSIPREVKRTINFRTHQIGRPYLSYARARL